VALRHRVGDEGVVGLQVQDVEFVDARRHDEQWPCVHLRCGRRILQHLLSSFSNTTLLGSFATLRPTSNAVSSVIETRPLAKSSTKSRMPCARLGAAGFYCGLQRFRIGEQRIGGAQRIDRLAQHEAPLGLGTRIKRRGGESAS